jgi:hypothetical protein
MANYSNLINSIKAVVKQNGTNDITGQLMQDVLVTMINTIGRYAAFAGTAMPSTNPNNPDQTVYYFTSIPGTYVNFGGIVVPPDRLVALHNIEGVWQMLVVATFGNGSLVPIDPALDPNSVNPVENRAVYAECQAIRALIADIPTAQPITSTWLNTTQATAITGETYVGKTILNFSATIIAGLDAIIVTGAKEVGTAGSGKLYVYGTGLTGGANTVEQIIYEVSGGNTLGDVIGVNAGIDNGALIVYAE